MQSEKIAEQECEEAIQKIQQCTLDTVRLKLEAIHYHDHIFERLTNAARNYGGRIQAGPTNSGNYYYYFIQIYPRKDQ